jgi:hypothetical protein
VIFIVIKIHLQLTLKLVLKLVICHLPGLKNIYRITADFLWILYGCPVRIIRLAIILFGFELRKLPVATKIGAIIRKE